LGGTRRQQYSPIGVIIGHRKLAAKFKDRQEPQVAG
jgi:hypothetical protein